MSQKPGVRSKKAEAIMNEADGSRLGGRHEEEVSVAVVILASPQMVRGKSLTYRIIFIILRGAKPRDQSINRLGR
jgi:hypothetical protein